ncbi:MAG: serine acetyltransferase [Candidatus Omnitrophica bacterium]|nr:serine acetyltransferase [Candidatus Omnitrophota bacterium]
MTANLPYYIWRLSNKFYSWHIPLIPFIIQQLLRFAFCCFIPYETKIGQNVHLAHMGMGIVIHKESVIGNNVQINQHVTIGGRVGPGAPIIGNNVIIGAGAKVLGNITLGDNVNIGANAVVITDVPINSTAVGVPARIIQR